MNYKQIINEIYGIDVSGYPGGSGIDESIIKEIEENLQLTLPEDLRNFYLLYGNIKELNHNDELFKPQDFFIDNWQGTKFLVIGKRYPFGGYYGINITNMDKSNTVIYKKEHVRIKDTFKHESIWQEKCTIESFLLSFMITNGFSGGLKYSFDTDTSQSVEDITKLINNKKLNVTIIDELSHSDADASNYHNYYIGEHYIISLFYVTREKYHAGYGHFSTNVKSVYREYKRLLITKGIKICKSEDEINNYKIHKKKYQMPVLRVVPGSYESYRKKIDKSIWIPEDSAYKLTDILKEVNADFDYYGISTEYSKEQISQLIELLSKRAEEMQNNENFMFHPRWKDMDYNDYYAHNNIEFRKYKKQIIKMFLDFINWLKNVEEDRINIIGV
jgi:hypothetical protein